MSQASQPMRRGILFWMLLPLRVFLHGARYVFGHPIPSIVAFAALAALLFYLGALPGPAAADGRVTAGAGNPIPGADTLAAVCAMVVGILIVWVSEHRHHANTVWTRAPSIWRPLGEPIVVDAGDEDADDEGTGGAAGAAPTTRIA